MQSNEEARNSTMQVFGTCKMVSRHRCLIVSSSAVGLEILQQNLTMVGCAKHKDKKMSYIRAQRGLHASRIEI